MRKLYGLIAGFFLLALPFSALAAVGYDSVSTGQSASVNPLTFTQTNVGTPTLLLCTVTPSTNTNVSPTMTVNGSSATLIDTQATGANYRSYLFGILNPTTGTVSINQGSAREIRAACTAYTGTSVTALPTNFFYYNGSGAAASPSIITTINNAWVWMSVVALSSVSAGVNTTFRGAGTTGGVDSAILDTNGVVTPAGNRTLNASFSSSSYDGWLVEIDPPAGATATTIFAPLFILFGDW